MSAVMGIDTAIGWAQWRLRGGWRSLATAVGGYVMILIVLILATLHFNPRGPSTLLAGWNSGLLAFQALVLVIFGGGRVAAAIRNDILRGMIESHRLMPVAPASAISGYLWGSTAHAVLFSCVTFIVGCLTTMAAGIDIRAWIGPNMILAIFAVFAWILTALSSASPRGGALVAGMMSFPLIFVRIGNGSNLCPGINLLITPLQGKTIFVTSLANADLTWPLVVSFCSQAYFGTIFFIGAARKYRRTDDTAFAVVPAIALLAGWVVVSAVGQLYWADFAMQLNRTRPDYEQMFHSSVLSSMFIALVPVANSARESRRGRRAMVITIACGIMVCLLSFIGFETVKRPTQALALTAAVVFAYLLLCHFLLRIAYRVGGRGFFMPSAWTLVVFPFPILLDLLRWLVEATRDDFHLGKISSFSPVGSLIMIWDERGPKDLAAGVVFQWAATILAAFLFYSTQRRRQQT